VPDADPATLKPPAQAAEELLAVVTAALADCLGQQPELETAS
jgi:hypothetical protein